MTRSATANSVVVLAALTSLPAFTKYSSAPVPLLIVYAAVFAAGLAASQRLTPLIERIPKLAISFCIASCLLLAGANGALYPATRVTSARSSAPEAMIEPAERMLHGRHPYAGLLSDGAPTSPGPGWIALNAPLSTTGAIWLLVPMYLLLAALMLARSSSASAAFFVGLMVTLPAFLQMSIVGHDLFAVGCAMLTATLGVHPAASRKGWRLIGWSVVVGVVSTARAPLAVLVGALGLVLGRHHRRTGVIFTTVAGSTLLAIHLTVMAWGYRQELAYQPLHVFGRAERAGSMIMPIGLALCTVLAIWQWRRGTETVSDCLRFVWTIAGLPFVVVGIGELLGPTGMDWINWEGKVYAGFALPLLIASVLLDGNNRVLLASTELCKSTKSS